MEAHRRQRDYERERPGEDEHARTYGYVVGEAFKPPAHSEVHDRRGNQKSHSDQPHELAGQQGNEVRDRSAEYGDGRRVKHDVRRGSMCRGVATLPLFCRNAPHAQMVDDSVSRHKSFFDATAMDDQHTLALSSGIGVVTGMRSMSGLAFVSRHLTNHVAVESRSAVLSLLGSKSFSRLITAMAAGEMAADKLPVIPSRTEPAPLIGRAALGALSGFAIAEHRASSRVAGALVGAVSAVAASFVFSRIRIEVASRTSIPDWIVAGLEDAIVLRAGSLIADKMDG